jgi:hypothetical protein
MHAAMNYEAELEVAFPERMSGRHGLHPGSSTIALTSVLGVETERCLTVLMLVGKNGSGTSQRSAVHMT